MHLHGLIPLWGISAVISPVSNISVILVHHISASKFREKKHEHHLAQHSPSPNYTTLLRWRQLTSTYMLNIMLSPNSLDSFVMLFRAYTMLYALRWLNWTLYGFMDSNRCMACDGKQKSRCRSIRKYLKVIGYGPFPLTTTRMMTFLVGNPYRPSFCHWHTGRVAYHPK